MDIPIKLKQTTDGSYTLFNDALSEHYHSVNGAIQESNHVFVQMGLLPLLPQKSEIHVFEVGFGTGLNALLAIKFAVENNIALHYVGLEPFPINETFFKDEPNKYFFEELGLTSWLSLNYKRLLTEERVNYSTLISIQLLQTSLLEFEDKGFADLVFFDAFSPNASPDLWSFDALKIATDTLKSGGKLVTYCAQGKVRRTFVELGNTAERLPGPPGKREMLRITKP